MVAIKYKGELINLDIDKLYSVTFSYFSQFKSGFCVSVAHTIAQAYKNESYTIIIEFAIQEGFDLYDFMEVSV